MSQRFWDSALEACLALPDLPIVERQSWLCRNLGELALMLLVTGASSDILDAAVRDTDLSRADPRFCRRLRQLRTRMGSCPFWYPIGSAFSDADVVRDIPELGRATHALARFANRIAEGAPNLTATPARVLQGVGKAAVQARQAWRTPGSRWTPGFIERDDINEELRWRSWMSLPGIGPTMVVVDERPDRNCLDLWWGVHVGMHLDHLASFKSTSVTPIEFGEGLLIAEGLAVAMELLAGAEAMVSGDRLTAAVVSRGIHERIDRLPRRRHPMRQSLRAAVQSKGAEFLALPTLAAAYIVEPIRLLDLGFEHPLIPDEIGEGLASRWEALAARSEAMAELRLLLTLVDDES